MGVITNNVLPVRAKYRDLFSCVERFSRLYELRFSSLLYLTTFQYTNIVYRI